MASTDGITWTARTAAELNGWYAVTYGNGLFVAVTNTGTNRVMTSPDGITWTARSVPAMGWSYVAYGNGTFAAVSFDGAVMYSKDGITWSLGTTAQANTWVGVTYGGGLFVAVSVDGTNRVMTSPDGVIWTARTAAEANAWYAVTYGNGQFVATADDGTHQVMTSPDGNTWTARTAGAVNQWRSVTYANGLYVALAPASSNQVMTSSDGITWTARSTASSNSWRSLVYGNSLLVAVSDDATYNVMTAGLTDPVPSNNKVTLSVTTPSDSDINSLLVLQNTSSITDKPVEGVTYATSSKLGTSDVTCAFTVNASSTYTCATSYNVFNGTLYYFKVFMRDSQGNYSEGVSYSTTTPNRVTTLGTGVDTSSSTLSIGGSATTSDTFTLVSDYSSDPISSVTITFASSTATSTSLVEITNDAGTVVYGSTSTPSSDSVTITTSGLYATTVQAQYRIRITPKSHTAMPVPPGASYAVTTYVQSFTSSVAGPLHIGSDYASTTITIDNASPNNVDSLGTVWRSRSASEANDWRSVTYGNGLFVAVSYDGTNHGLRLLCPNGRQTILLRRYHLDSKSGCRCK